MNDKIVAIDAKDFIRKSNLLGKSFKAPLGVAVKINNYSSFSVKYLDTIRELKSQYGIVSSLKILKSYDILERLRSRGLEFMEKVVSSLNGEIDSTLIYYTTIPSKKIAKVKMYWGDKGGLEQVPPIEFIGQLSNYYPHVCAWRYFKDNPAETDIPIFMDYFEGNITPAWEELQMRDHLYVGSDSTHPAISFADIITKVIDYRLGVQHKKLFWTDILDVARDLNAKTVFIDQLYQIAPKYKAKIDLNNKMIRPVVYILKEGMEKKETLFRPEGKMIEESPSMERILNFATDLGTNYKFYDPSLDQRNIRESDYFIYLGENGKRLANYLLTLGYKIIIKSVGDLS
jgi:hypothetical protein